MSLFGIKEHEERHDEVERQLRRLIEQVAQLSIDLGVTRTELRRLALTVEGKVSTADVDPSIVALNESIRRARAKLADTKASTEESWAAVSEELSETIDELRAGLDEGDG